MAYFTTLMNDLIWFIRLDRTTYSENAGNRIVLGRHSEAYTLYSPGLKTGTPERGAGGKCPSCPLLRGRCKSALFVNNYDHFDN